MTEGPMPGRQLFGPAKPSDVTIADKIKEIERELKMRHKVYPELVDRNRLSREEAAKRILVLRAILNDYRQRAEQS